LPAIEPWIVQPTVKSLYLLCFPTPYISYTVSREILVIPVLLTVSGQSKLQQQSATCHKDNITWLCTQKLICCKLLPWTSSCTSWWSWPYRLLAWQKYDPLSAASAPAICSSARTPSGVESCFTETLN
jgi:hypothetical protein